MAANWWPLGRRTLKERGEKKNVGAKEWGGGGEGKAESGGSNGLTHRALLMLKNFSPNLFCGLSKQGNHIEGIYLAYLPVRW